MDYADGGNMYNRIAQ